MSYRCVLDSCVGSVQVLQVIEKELGRALSLLHRGELLCLLALAARFPRMEAARANALLESGQVVGNGVLAAEEE